MAFLVIVACSNPVGHIPEINPEQLRAMPTKDPPPTEQTYKMVPYDLITIKFTYHPEQDPKTPVVIRPDGNITLDGIGAVRAAGLTPEELGKGDRREEFQAPEKSRGPRDPYPICTEENICGWVGKITRHS